MGQKNPFFRHDTRRRDLLYRWQESAFLIYTREEIITARKPYSHSIVEGGFEEMS